MKQKVMAIIGARPQFIKHYPFELEAIKYFDLITIHTGQHYDENMSQVFFDQLGMRKPNYMLNLGGGNHGEQTAKMMIEIEKIVLHEKPNSMVVYGDTNSTLAGALIASKLNIKLIHIEAGLRSYNKEMPEEVNRVLTDHISDLLLVPSMVSQLNLQKEGITKGVEVVGDVMKDIIRISREKDIFSEPTYKNYFYATLHRPYNVDQKDRLSYVMESLAETQQNIVFAMHPRTRNKIKDFGIPIGKQITIISPQPYFENLSLLIHSKGLITDSGGMQKEAYWLEKPCFTIRKETEWVETLDGGANHLMYKDLSDLGLMLKSERKIHFDNNLYGDGYAAEKMVKEIQNLN